MHFHLTSLIKLMTSDYYKTFLVVSIGFVTADGLFLCDLCFIFLISMYCEGIHSYSLSLPFCSYQLSE